MVHVILQISADKGLMYHGMLWHIRHQSTGKVMFIIIVLNNMIHAAIIIQFHQPPERM